MTCPLFRSQSQPEPVVPAVFICFDVLPELLPNSLQGLLAFQEEAVKYTAPIKEVSDDRPRRVGGNGEGALAYAGARARGIKRGEAAVLSPHEAVIHRACVNVISHDRPHWVDSLGYRALAGACTRFSVRPD
jgi:hypothetical protein